jgi:hypothetical protein
MPRCDKNTINPPPFNLSVAARYALTGFLQGNSEAVAKIAEIADLQLRIVNSSRNRPVTKDLKRKLRKKADASFKCAVELAELEKLDAAEERVLWTEDWYLTGDFRRLAKECEALCRQLESTVSRYEPKQGAPERNWRRLVLDVGRVLLMAGVHPSAKQCKSFQNNLTEVLSIVFKDMSEQCGWPDRDKASFWIKQLHKELEQLEVSVAVELKFGPHSYDPAYETEWDFCEM